MVVQAELSLAAPHAAPLGVQRVRLLEAVGREGSISGAARAVGLSYRAAWDAIWAMNNLVGAPLVVAQPGGARGGGARLTAEGVRLIETFHRLQTEMARAFRSLAPELAGEGAVAARLMCGGFLRTSARNALRGEIATVVEGPVNAEVGLEVAGAGLLTVSLTRHSLHELGLFPGRAATALVKAPLIRLLPPAPGGLPNRLAGTVERVETGPGSTEILVGIGGGKTLCAIVAHADAPPPAHAPGDPVTAEIDPCHIILAVE